jgi:hypothetical protein
MNTARRRTSSYTVSVGTSYEIDAVRLTKSFTLDAEINEYVDTTKGDRSASERVNELLRRAMLEERYEQLEAEAAAFFAHAAGDRSEAKAFQKAASRTFDRD